MMRFTMSRRTNGIARDYLTALGKVIAKVRDEKATGAPTRPAQR